MTPLEKDRWSKHLARLCAELHRDTRRLDNLADAEHAQRCLYDALERVMAARHLIRELPDRDEAPR